MENMTIAQLKEVAERKGIVIPAKAKKAEIVALLEESKKTRSTGKKSDNGSEKPVERKKAIRESGEW
jgi:hypothetical protein